MGYLALALLLCLVAGELVARFYFGLGDPPLSVADPQIEYLFKPNQTVHRFGNLIHYNAWSMRSDDFPKRKTDPRELRVLVVGDSVVNGGSQTDQNQLATSILQRKLAEDLGRPVIVGNVSAGSWGPPNELAYLKKFGLFDADVVVIVLSSHDVADVPTFEPVVGVSPDMPDVRPVSALWELLSRYGPRLWSGLRQRVPTTGPSQNPNEPGNAGALPPAAVRECTDAVHQMIRLAENAGAAVIVAQHLEREELNGHAKPGHELLAAAARDEGIDPVQLGPEFQAAVSRGEDPYRDPIHPNAAGQRLIAKTLLPRIESLLRSRSAAPATSQKSSRLPATLHEWTWLGAEGKTPWSACAVLSARPLKRLAWQWGWDCSGCSGPVDHRFG